ncbi:MAG: GatB/YqeY domain-containing protein [Patescibacteria group bacterium]
MLLSTIDEKLVAAMREKNETMLSVLRMLKTAVKNKMIEKGSELGESEVLDVLGKEAKKRKESATVYRNNNRDDLAQEEEKEYDIIASFLPEQMNEETIKATILEVIASLSEEDKGKTGSIMRELMPKIKGKADGSVVNRILGEILSQK